MSGTDDIAAERDRQVASEHYDSLHDDQYTAGQLATAAACYAIARPLYVEERRAGMAIFQDPWPWADHFDKRKDAANWPNAIPPVGGEPRRDMLVKAGALIAAEIDRLDRAANA